MTRGRYLYKQLCKTISQHAENGYYITHTNIDPQADIQMLDQFTDTQRKTSSGTYYVIDCTSIFGTLLAEYILERR